MAEQIDDGGLAFPHPGGANDATVQVSHLGMSLRDYFAGQAISCVPLRSWDHVGIDDLQRIEAWAKCSYLAADALIAARKGGK